MKGEALQQWIDKGEVEPDDGNAKDQGVDAIEHPAMAGKEAAGILYAGAAFASGFEEVAHLSGDVAERGHGEEMRKRDGEPEVESIGDQERAEQAGDGAFPGLFRGDMRGEGVFAERAAGEVRNGVGGPGDHEGEQEQAGTFDRKSMQTAREGQRKCNEQESG